MTSKNLSISTENPTLILRCRTAWRLRFAICTLIFSTCILSVLNNAYAQAFENSLKPGIYNNQQDLITNMKPGQALLLWDRYPEGVVSVNSIITYKDIVSSDYDVSKFNQTGNAYGFFTTYRNDSNEIVRSFCSLVDAQYFYTAGSVPGFDTVTSQLQDQMEKIGLGTVSSRRSYISFLYSKIAVSPVDFRGYVQPWVVSGLVIAILIPAWYLCRRFLRG